MYKCFGAITVNKYKKKKGGRVGGGKKSFFHYRSLRSFPDYTWRADLGDHTYSEDTSLNWLLNTQSKSLPSSLKSF